MVYIYTWAHQNLVNSLSVNDCILFLFRCNNLFGIVVVCFPQNVFNKTIKYNSISGIV